mgnify:CR=1 FL=1
MNNLHVKTGDNVMIISGKDKGHTGKVLQVSPSENKVIVEGQNMVTKHVKPRRQGEQGGIVKAEGAMYASKVMPICPKCGKGRMLERKSAKGRIYYGCERYPDCDFMTWDTPVPTKCEKCGSTLFRKGSKLYCAKEGCGFEMPVPKKE